MTAPTTRSPAARENPPSTPSHRSTAGRPGLLGWVHLLRPWFWPVSWAPAAFGVILGSGGWPSPTPQMVLAVLVMGPLVWGSVLLANDRHDLPTDRLNPRKTGSPLVRGDTATRALTRVQAVLSVAAVLVAFAVAPLFALGTGLVLALGWSYSCPPLRLKSRPGADVAVNALAVGVLAPLGGWSLVRPALDYPLALAALGMVVGSALYLPTTVIDRAADQLAGIQTFAVRCGEGTAYRLGVGLWTVGVLGWLAWCGAGDRIGPGAVLVQVAVCLPLIPLYAVLVAHPSIPRLAVVSTGFMCAALCFIGAYAGWPA